MTPDDRIQFQSMQASPPELCCHAFDLLTSDPSFWSAIRHEWEMDPEWLPKANGFAVVASPTWASTAPPFRARIVEIFIPDTEGGPDIDNDDDDEDIDCVASERSGPDYQFLVEDSDGCRFAVGPESLGPPPHVPWEAVKRHAMPRLVAAGVDHSILDWVQLSGALFQDNDPAHEADAQAPTQEDDSASTPDF